MIIARLTPWLFLAPALAVMGVALLDPAGHMPWAGFLNWNPSQRIGEAAFVGLADHVRLMGDAAMRESFLVTLRFAAVGVALEMALGSTAPAALTEPNSGRVNGRWSPSRTVRISAMRGPAPPSTATTRSVSKCATNPPIPKKPGASGPAATPRARKSGASGLSGPVGSRALRPGWRR